ncbi:S8 family serine peptidase [Nocardioides sp. SYSU D00038]|uniref:S8 family serine peptidase n=1 Tax=Nocardioides sp. SYSU D00038 TaxID=2812554 RepID=UPI001966E7F1|nr:S8 family serine peptidase [Nocardioides sp. SYSU D00038]
MTSPRPGVLVAGSLAAGLLVAAPATPAVAAVEADCTEVTTTTEPVATDRRSEPLELLGMDDVDAELERRGRRPGQGVVVAVVDSGVAPSADVAFAGRESFVPSAEVTYHHGTAVAGLIAGRPQGDQRIGIAPAARILDLKVYDDPVGSTDNGTEPVRTPAVVAALRSALRKAKAGMNLRVVNVSLALPDDPRVERQVRRLWRAGAVVVAPSGNRPQGSDDPFYETFPEFVPGENAAEVVFPAGYDDVVAVSTTADGAGRGDDPTPWVLWNTATDLAAPTAGGVSFSVNGGTCLLTEPATSWAAAEVSGVLALLQSVYDESPARAVARLLATADGRPDVPNPLAGAGVVRPLEALTRPLRIDEDGTPEQVRVEPAPQKADAPQRPPDVLAETRHDAVWWGLLGGAALVLAVVLRPVLSRQRSRRTTTS